MPYIQLNTLTLPTTVTNDVVFPFLLTDAATPAHYSLAFLVADTNAAARAVLGILDFVLDTTTTLPTGTGPSAKWHFYQNKSSPFLPLTDDATAPPTHQLATYLQITFLTPPTGAVWKPDHLHVLQNTVSSDLLDGTFKLNGLSTFITMKGSNTSWSLAFAASANTDVVAVSFSLPVTIPAQATYGLPQGDVTFGLAASSPQTTTWAGGYLRANGANISGSVFDRVAFPGGALVIQPAATASADPTLTLQVNCQADLVLRFGPGQLAQLTLSSDDVAIRIDSQGAGVYLHSDGAGGPIVLTFDAEFSLIMAAGAVKSLPLLMPLQRQVKNLSSNGSAVDAPTLNYRFGIEVDNIWQKQDDPLFRLYDLNVKGVPAGVVGWDWRDFLNAAFSGGWNILAADQGGANGVL